MAYDFVIGVDVGKYFHHACVLDPQGRQVLSKRINQHEGSLRKLFGQFLADNTSVLVIVDQPNNIGRLTVAVAQDMGADVRDLPGVAMRQLSRIGGGNVLARGARVTPLPKGRRFTGAGRNAIGSPKPAARCCGARPCPRARSQARS